MKLMWAQRWSQSDIPEATSWFMGLADKNLYDPKVLLYPATEVMKVASSEKTVLYMPFQSVLMGESLGIAPDATPMETASGLRAAFTALVWEAKAKGHGEIYFPCRDEQTVKFAEHNGFERLDIPMFRMKI